MIPVAFGKQNRKQVKHCKNLSLKKPSNIHLQLQFLFPALQHYKGFSNFLSQEKAVFLTLTTKWKGSLDADSVKKKTITVRYAEKSIYGKTQK